jgi:hypothetical protein
MIVNFGKYKGQKVSELPLDYLAWGAMNLNNKWEKIFHDAYHKKLQPCDHKYRVFRDNLSFTVAFSTRIDIYKALNLHRQEWKETKYVIRELKNEFLIYPVELPTHKKLILNEALEYYANDDDEDWQAMYGDDHADGDAWEGMFDV